MVTGDVKGVGVSGDIYVRYHGRPRGYSVHVVANRNQGTRNDGEKFVHKTV